MRTYAPRPADVTRSWYVVDAEGEVLGRLATRIATVLNGKHKPTWAPHVDGGDHVIVVGAGQLVLTGAKATQMHANWHSGYPGGLTSVPFSRMLETRPEELLRRTVKGMLPKNQIGAAALQRLRVYAGPTHPHQAQKPQPLHEAPGLDT